MSNTVTLTIQNQQVDTHGDESITLTSKTKDFSDISKIFTEFTTQFSLPASKRNNQVFQHYWDIDIVYSNTLALGNVDYRLKHRCSIMINGAPFKDGWIKLNSISMKNGMPEDYKCIFFGQLTTFQAIFGETLVSSLDWSDLDHELRSATSVGVGLSSVTSLFDDKIIYPLINSTKQEWTAQRLGDGTSIVPDDFSPAVQVKEIMERIELQYGITFYSTVFDSTHFSKMYMWLPQRFSEKQLDLAKQQGAKLLFTTYEDLTVDEFFHPVNPESSTIYTTEFPVSWSTFNLTITITPVAGYTTEPYEVSIGAADEEYGETKLITGQLQSGVGTQVFNFTMNRNNETGQKYLSFFVNSTTRINPFECDHAITNTTVTFFTQSWPVFTASASGIFYQDETKQIKNTFLKLTVIDFIKNLIKMYNLVIIPINEIEFNIYTYDEWLSLGKLVNLSDYIELDQHIVNVVNLPKTLSFEYKEPKAEGGKEFLDLFHEAYGDEHQQTQGYGEEYKVEVKEYENLLWDRIDGTSSEYYVGKSYTANGTDGSLTGVNDSIYMMYWGRDATADIFIDGVASFPTYKMCDSYYPSINPTNSLNFGAENSPYTTTPHNTINLYSQYYNNMISVMLNSYTKNYEFEAVIPSYIFSTLKNNDTIQIGTNFFNIQEFDINMLSNEMKIKLVNTLRSIQAVEIPPDTSPPSATTIYKVSTTRNTIDLRWDPAVDDVGVVNYRKYGTGWGGATGNNLTYTQEMTSPGTYTYAVAAIDAELNEAPVSNYVSHTFVDVDDPVWVGNLTKGTTTQTSMRVHWLEASDDWGIQQYNIYVDEVLYDSTQNLSYNLTGQSVNTTVDIEVEAEDLGGNISQRSNVITHTFSDITAPSIPVVVNSGNDTATQTEISWTPSTDNVGVTAYRTWQAEDGGIPVLMSGNLTPGFDKFTFTGLVGGVDYEFFVTAKDAAGNESDLSIPVERRIAVPTWPVTLAVTSPESSSPICSVSTNQQWHMDTATMGSGTQVYETSAGLVKAEGLGSGTWFGINSTSQRARLADGYCSAVAGCFG